VHGVVVSCAAEGGQAAEEGEGAGVRFDVETEVQAGNLGDDWEASSVWLDMVEMRVWEVHTSKSRKGQFALSSGRRVRGWRRGSG
jgi:hypothetical protein